MKLGNAGSPTMTKLHEAIVVHLVDAIVSGAYPVGACLPNEMELATTHGVSRTAAREAMQKLASLGLIESRRRKGATVLARESWKLLDASLLGVAVLRVEDVSFFQALVEARLLIEPRAAELAAVRASEAELVRIEASLDVMASEADGTRGAGWAAADVAFHAGIIEAAGNWVFTQLISTVRAALDAGIRLTGGQALSAHASLEQHRAVFDAIRRRQPAEAHAAMTRLLLATQRDFNELEKGAVRAAVAGGDRASARPDLQEQDIG
jgi:GntR family transcriptional regulator, galactonate operon transcriptional repressor